MLSVRGRRRVGKSTLIDHFVRDGRIPAVYFTATQQSTDVELRRFVAELAGSELPVGEQIRAGVEPRSWEAALRLVADAAGERPGVVVIDELPYLVAGDPSFESVLQAVWDRHLSRAPVLLILIGSNLSMMEAIGAYERPLYGRIDRQLAIDPLSVAEIAELLELGPVDALDAYVVIGGFPQLALAWPRGSSLLDHLADVLEDSTAPLIVHGERVLAAELPAASQPETVLRAIGCDATTAKRMQDRTGIGQASLHNALGVLERARMIVREVPFGAKPNSRLTRYAIADPALRFWLRFVGPQLELIERGRGRDLVLPRVREQLPVYRGRAIEPIVRRSIERLLPDPRFGDAEVVGAYWNRDHSIEVDLVGGDARRAAFVGSIKWRDARPFGRRDLAALDGVAPRLPLVDEDTLRIGVSRGGFGAGADGLDIALEPEAIVAAWR